MTNLMIANIKTEKARDNFGLLTIVVLNKLERKFLSETTIKASKQAIDT